jgi:hypothetical protein
MNRIAVTADRNDWKHKLQNAAKFAAFDSCAAKHRKGAHWHRQAADTSALFV